MMEKQIKKQHREKLQRKLQNRKLTLYESLQEEISIDWLKSGNPAFLTMLNAESMAEIINFVTVVGPPQDKIRSFKVPMIAAELLSALIPKVFELFFLEDEKEKGGHVLGKLLRYFQGQPNYVLSGYVVRILMNLMIGNAGRVLQYVLKNQPQRMLRFLDSQSIAQYLLRIIIVEDALLNNQAKQRINLLLLIVQIYKENKQSEEILANINWLLGQALIRLWTQKHKQLGRFSGVLFKLVDILLEQNNLYQQENLLIIVAKHLTLYSKEGPFLIIALYRKIYNQFLSKSGELIKTQAKFQMPKLNIKKYKYLQALFYIFSHSCEAIGKSLLTTNIFPQLLDCISRYQWNSMALVEIEKIIKAVINSNCEMAYTALARSYFHQKLKELARIQNNETKYGCGYSGFLKNIISFLKTILQTNHAYTLFLRKSNNQNQFLLFLNDYLTHKDTPLEKGRDTYKVIHNVAKPYYSISKLPEIFSSFFQETDEINLRMQKQSPGKHLKQEQDVLHEIQNQNQLVYKLLSQLVSENVVEEKKADESSD